MDRMRSVKWAATSRRAAIDAPSRKQSMLRFPGRDGVAEVDALQPGHPVVGQVGREVAAGSDVVAEHQNVEIVRPYSRHTPLHRLG